MSILFFDVITDKAHCWLHYHPPPLDLKGQIPHFSSMCIAQKTSLKTAPGEVKGRKDGGGEG